MRQLNPTLWRTCRVLAGQTRVKLLRQLHDRPGQSVSDLAKTVGIGVSDASQELRRLQSRGLLQAERNGARLIYRLGADPQVPSAAPLLSALKSTLTRTPPECDRDIIPIATGLAHFRRITIAKALLAAPQMEVDLRGATRIPAASLNGHVRALITSGFVRRFRGLLQFYVPAHPLARTLVKLLQTR